MRLSLQGGRPEIRREVIRGSAEQIIRVRVPVPGLFREAVFFLHEDVLRRSDISREELLRQARQSAEDYLRPMLPEKKPGRWPKVLLLLAGMALGFGLGVLIRI
ncbi:MAG: hypothetical protein IJL51_06080 [Oscillospiraceae bacterium]|nr:hypothetical protein [Oscillospiraceae bacterium]